MLSNIQNKKVLPAKNNSDGNQDAKFLNSEYNHTQENGDQSEVIDTNKKEQTEYNHDHTSIPIIFYGSNEDKLYGNEEIPQLSISLNKSELKNVSNLEQFKTILTKELGQKKITDISNDHEKITLVSLLNRKLYGIDNEVNIVRYTKDNDTGHDVQYHYKGYDNDGDYKTLLYTLYRAITENKSSYLTIENPTPLEVKGDIKKIKILAGAIRKTSPFPCDDE